MKGYRRWKRIWPLLVELPQAAVEESNFIVVLHKVLFVLNVGGFFFFFYDVHVRSPVAIYLTDMLHHRKTSYFSDDNHAMFLHRYIIVLGVVQMKVWCSSKYTPRWLGNKQTNLQSKKEINIWRTMKNNIIQRLISEKSNWLFIGTMLRPLCIL